MINDNEIVADYVKLNEIYAEKDGLNEKLELLYETLTAAEDLLGETP